MSKTFCCVYSVKQYRYIPIYAFEIEKGIKQNGCCNGFTFRWREGEWFANGGAYHAFYMWHGGNHYGHTAAAGLLTSYSDDVHLRFDGTPNEPKYTHISRLHHLLADRAQALVSQDSIRTSVPYWDGKQWSIGTEQFVFSYAASTHFLIDDAESQLFVLFNNQNISIAAHFVQIYDYNQRLLWNSTNTNDINSNNTAIVSVVRRPLKWKFFIEPSKSNLPKITDPYPLEQLNLTNDETIYLWYRRNISLTQPSEKSIVQVQTRVANSLLFFLNGQFLGNFDERSPGQGTITIKVPFNLTQFHPNEQYLFEILSVSLGIDNYNIGPGHFDYKGIIDNISIDGQSLVGNETCLWEYQKDLFGEAAQIYTEQGSKTVKWNSQWTTAINKSVSWFQTRFDLDHLTRQDLNANPLLVDALGLNRGHIFVNGNDLGLYWLIEGDCQLSRLCCCLQNQAHCGQPSQRYYHIPSDWLMSKNNLLTVFEDLGAPSPAFVGIVQRIILT